MLPMNQCIGHYRTATHMCYTVLRVLHVMFVCWLVVGDLKLLRLFFEYINIIKTILNRNQMHTYEKVGLKFENKKEIVTKYILMFTDSVSCTACTHLLKVSIHASKHNDVSSKSHQR